MHTEEDTFLVAEKSYDWDAHAHRTTYTVLNDTEMTELIINGCDDDLLWVIENPDSSDAEFFLYAEYRQDKLTALSEA